MILRTLETQNFRQLYGLARMRFAPPGDQNVTVFLGENASGKSTMLLAIKWCLHGDDALKDTGIRNVTDMASHRAQEETPTGHALTVLVSLEYEHGGARYRVEREREYTKVGKGKGLRQAYENFTVRLREPSAGGGHDWRPLEAPLDEVRRVLPMSLLPYFLFAGEAAGAMVDPRQADGLREAVVSVLDLEILSRAFQHLGTVQAGLNRELKELAKADGSGLEERIAIAQSKHDQLEKEIDTLRRELLALNKDRAQVEKHLQDYKETQPLIEQKRSLDAQQHATSQHLEGVENDLITAISKRGYLAFLKPTAERVKAQLEEAYRRDDLPARIKPGFVDSLLERESCICGSDLSEGTPFRKSLSDFRQSTGLDTVAEALMELNGWVNRAVDDVAEFEVELRKKEGERNQLRMKLSGIQTQLGELERQLEGKRSDETELQALLDKNRKLNSDASKMEGELARKRDRLGDSLDPSPQSAKVVLADLIAQRDALHRGNREAELLNKQLKVLERTKTGVERLHSGWIAIIQQYLDARIQAVYDDMAVLERRVTFNEDFRLSMQEQVDGKWIESDTSGANQAVLALCFVAAFVNLADHVTQDAPRGGQGFDTISAGRYPMVMDAPFAKMGEHFSGKVPTYLAESVPQLVIMTSEKQWLGAVENSLRSRVGSSYLLHLHTNRGADRAVEFLGREVDYVRHDENANPDFTLIQELA